MHTSWDRLEIFLPKYGQHEPATEKHFGWLEHLSSSLEGQQSLYQIARFIPPGQAVGVGDQLCLYLFSGLGSPRHLLDGSGTQQTCEPASTKPPILLQCTNDDSLTYPSPDAGTSDLGRCPIM